MWEIATLGKCKVILMFSDRLRSIGQNCDVNWIRTRDLT